VIADADESMTDSKLLQKPKGSNGRNTTSSTAKTREQRMSELMAHLDALIEQHAAPVKMDAEESLAELSPVVPAAAQVSSTMLAEPVFAETPVLAVASSPAESPRSGCTLPEELKRATIMVIDDEEVNILAVIHHLKKEGYENFISTCNPREAISAIRGQRPDAILLDIMMPGVSGLDILRVISRDDELRHIPVIVLTATTDPTTKREALDLGANDFLTKPVDPNDLIPRVRNALVVKNHYDQMVDQAASLSELVNRRTAELFQSRQQLIVSLARAAEHRDNETGNHVLRVGQYSAIIARRLGWSDQQVEMIEQAAQLHDVGKIGIPDAILFKPGKLDPHEYELIKTHCAIGKEIIEPLSEKDYQLLRRHTRIGEEILHVRSSPMLMMASRIAQTHHENWNGTGYPLGLAGEDIPIEGRITAVADVFDALSTKRPYKDPFPREKCFAILNEQRGKKFDPQVLDAFFACSPQIIDVQMGYSDT
jgi:putative two-component system response regulator